MKNSILATTSNADLPDKEFLDLLAFNEKMAELGRISAGIIHEVNTPLSVIISAAQLVMQEEGLPEAALEMVERIHAGSPATVADDPRHPLLCPPER